MSDADEIAKTFWVVLILVIFVSVSCMEYGDGRYSRPEGGNDRAKLYTHINGGDYEN